MPRKLLLYDRRHGEESRGRSIRRMCGSRSTSRPIAGWASTSCSFAPRAGISDYRSFFVGALPGVDEKEPNSSFDEPQPIELNVCVAGVLQNEDADYYRIHAKKGQRISVEVEGIRLGQAFFDPFLAILDKNRFELAAVDDTVLAKQDGFLSVIIPEDGDYTILVRESFVPRRRQLPLPLARRQLSAADGGLSGRRQAWRAAEGAVSGRCQPARSSRQITVPADPQAAPSCSSTMSQGVTPSAVPFRAFSDGNVLEAEPNDAFEDGHAAELPLALNGRLEKQGDVDFFKLSRQEGAGLGNRVLCPADRFAGRSGHQYLQSG